MEKSIRGPHFSKTAITVTQSPNPQHESRYEDSRLKEFLRRAAPILAAERGWNERSQLKIKSLAKELRLPESLYEQGVNKLREGKLRYEERFTVYERAFLKKLESDFRKSKTSVFTAAQEDSVIKIAVSEYQIPQMRAREIIREAAEQMGIRRVSKRDASEYLSRLIKEQASGEGHLSGSAHARIQQAAEKWGLNESEIESILSEHENVSLNRQNPQRKIALGFLLVSILLAISTGLYYWSWSQSKFAPISPSPQPESKAANTAPTPTETIPDWWSVATTERVERFLRDHRADRISQGSLESDDLQDRLQAYQEILDLAYSAGVDFSIDSRVLFASLFHDETIEACRKMAKMIDQAAALPTDQIPANPRAFARGWQAFELLCKCYEQSADSPKRQLLESSLVKMTGKSRTQSETVDQLKQPYSDQQWRYLEISSSKNPALAASLLDPLGDLTREYLPQGNDLEFSTSTNLLRLNPATWKRMPKTLGRIVDSADEDQLRVLYLIQRQTGDSEFQSWLGLRIAERLDLNTQSMTAAKIIETIGKRLNLPASGRRINKEPKLQLKAIRGLDEFLDSDLVPEPQTIAKAAHFATVALLLREAEKRTNPKLIAKANELMQKGSPSLKPGISNSETNLPIYRAIERRALPSDIRAQEVALRKLVKAEQNSDSINATAFERLARSAPRFRDVSWPDALTIASFILEAKGDSERVEIEKNLGKLRHWPNLGLALATQIKATDGGLDQAMTCVSLLMDFQPAITGNDWRGELSKQVRQRVAQGLKYTSEINGTDSRYQWEALRVVLIEQYRTRCVLFGVSNIQANSTSSPPELATLLTKAASAEAPPIVEKKIKCNAYISENEMQLFALQAALAADSLNLGTAPNKTANIETPGAALLRIEMRILESLTEVQP